MKQASTILFLLATYFGYASSVFSISLDALNETREWRVEKINLSGSKLFTEDALRAELLTKERPWYQFWGQHPAFDPVTFESDLERLRRFYEARGYYDVTIEHDLTVDDKSSLLSISIRVHEGGPIIVSEVDVAVIGDLPEAERPALPDTLPVKTGAVFQETDYQHAEQMLRQLYLRNGYAHVESTRKAEVNTDLRRARIRYTIDPGPPTVFGATEIRGLASVDPELVRRELVYSAGAKFSSEKIAESRAKLLALDLFSSVRIGPKQTTNKLTVVPMVIEITEKPHREFTVGLGYSTEEELKAQVQWRHLNWLGGGRQLKIGAKYTSIVTGGAVELVQPHFLTPRTKALLAFNFDQESEQTYLRKFTGFMPRINHQFSPTLSGFLRYRVEYDKLSDISAATEQALGGIRRDGTLSGPTLGLLWSTADNPFYPKQGTILSLAVEQAGVIWGGAYRFFKITGEAKKYYEIGWDTVFAGRVKLGFGDAIGSLDRYPLFERFYAGGEKSVRGYGRRRLGPISASNDPLGGLSLLEGSVELRRPIWRELGGALFVDFGQVTLEPFDAGIFDLKFASGFGLSYNTPVGPLRFDVGFPFKKPPRDRPWQIHFSIGASF